MAYNEQLADRIRERFADLPQVEEKKMMGGWTVMYNGKMCVGIIKDDLMCRIDPALYETLLEKEGCHPMEFTGRPLKGYVLVDELALKTQKDFDYWIDLALDFNKKAKASKKRPRK
ncbi:TfoX/Sxy family protein [Salmonirosea aquatica]|uniref:RNA methyltransferase n=1 Tax=Salmonirosea aquatica TaxID=2654236 RepID=A0A7C9FZI7_9BACT|nr:RNA methyltransferase [Cytophagaceae bacterium SJW1-29]